MKNLCRPQASSAPVWRPLPSAEYPGKGMQPKVDKQGTPASARPGEAPGSSLQTGASSLGLLPPAKPQPSLKFNRHLC